MEYDKTLQQISIDRCLSPDVHLEEKANDEKTNDECSEAKSGETKRLSMEIEPDNRGTVLRQVQEHEQEHRQEREAEDNGRERLKKHRREVAGRVWVPEIWGQEEFLKDWSDCSGFDACLIPRRIASARAALVEEGRRANSAGLRVENR